MKLVFVTSVLTAFLCSFIFLSSCNDDSALKANNNNTLTADTASASIDGAWKLVWSKYNGEVANPVDNRQFKMFHDGVFSLIATDSSGKISFAGYGKFELDAHTYHETFLYNNNPNYVGAIDWQEYELNDDTLYMKGFIKVLIDGKDSTANFPKFEEKRVRIN